ncbi:MAG TPA: transposase [Gaiellaceae bacterium]|nr:transposase [Gaiellaceae bacterium]
MPRRLRIQAPDTLYHVTGNATDRWQLFVEDEDREHFLSTFASVVQKYEWTCLSFALMGTHDHLLFRTTHANIAAGMQELNSRYAQDFNRRHSRPGHLFRARYGAVVVEEPGHLLWCIRYIARNPVEAGLCPGPADWSWSSYPGLVGIGRSWPFVAGGEVLGLFGQDRKAAISRLRDFVE